MESRRQLNALGVVLGMTFLIAPSAPKFRLWLQSSRQAAPARANPPTTINLTDVDNNAGLFSTTLSDFVKALGDGDQIDNYKRIPVYKDDGTQCNLYFAPTVGSHEIAKKPDGNPQYAYVVGVLANFDDCHAHKLNIPNGKRAAWVIEFDSVSVPGKRMVMGKARLLILHKHVTGGDDYLSGKEGWTFSQCGHQGDDNRPDDATILTRDTVCPKTATYMHNSTSIVASITRTPAHTLTAGDDPSLWFACGGDCCYSDISK